MYSKKNSGEREFLQDAYNIGYGHFKTIETPRSFKKYKLIVFQLMGNQIAQVPRAATGGIFRNICSFFPGGEYSRKNPGTISFQNTPTKSRNQKENTCS